MLTISILGAVLWCLIVFSIFYLHQTPKAHVRRRMNIMIRDAEAIRTKSAQRQLHESKSSPQQHVVKKTFFYRIVKPILSNAEKRLQNLAPSSLKRMFENYIFRAGKQGIWSVQRLAAFWVISVLAGFFIAFLIVQNTQFYFSQQTVILLLGAVAGAFFPFLVLKSKISNRQKELKRQLPEFLDLLCVSVQAGLSFDGAVSKITGKMKGGLADEFKHMQNDVRLGMTRQYALTQMAKRCDLEEIYLFTTSIIQAEKLGTSMSQTLRLQSDNMRERHRQYVKTEAMKAPVKIIFPMVLFIFPSIFVILLFPAIITLMKTLGK